MGCGWPDSTVTAPCEECLAVPLGLSSSTSWYWPLQRNRIPLLKLSSLISLSSCKCCSLWALSSTWLNLVRSPWLSCLRGPWDTPHREGSLGARLCLHRAEPKQSSVISANSNLSWFIEKASTELRNLSSQNLSVQKAWSSLLDMMKNTKLTGKMNNHNFVTWTFIVCFIEKEISLQLPPNMAHDMRFFAHYIPF